MRDSRLLIDRNSLDDELENNPSLVQDVCDEAAEAIAFRDAQKEKLNTTDAELDAEVREELAKTGKVTEDKVKAAIQVHPRHAQAFHDANMAKLAAAKADSLVESVKTRSKSLEQLSFLFAAGYFAINSTKRSSTSQELQYNRSRKLLAKARSKS